RFSSAEPPHPAVRISRRTASAIRFALEEALRVPIPFTPDLIEENASMSDLPAGGQSAPAGGNGRGTGASNGAPRATQGPGQVSSPSRSEVKGPREIMRERRRREEERARVEEEERARRERPLAAGVV